MKHPIVCSAVNVGSKTLVHNLSRRAFEWNTVDYVFGFEELVEAGFRVCADGEALGTDWVGAFGVNRPWLLSAYAFWTEDRSQDIGATHTRRRS